MGFETATFRKTLRRRHNRLSHEIGSDHTVMKASYYHLWTGNYKRLAFLFFHLN